MIVGFAERYHQTCLAAGCRSTADRSCCWQAWGDTSLILRCYKPFFQRMDFQVVGEQSVKCRGVSLTNFKMGRTVGFKHLVLRW